MKGILVDFNVQLDEGVISGEDGKRYSFLGCEWKDLQAPKLGQRVSFTINELGQATNIHLGSSITQSTDVKAPSDLPKSKQLDEEEYYTPFDWAMKCLRNYANFSGRARRKEYWYFYLMQILIGFVIGIVLGIVGGSDNTMNTVSTLLSVALLVPGLAVGARRLHDVNRSGWWLLLILTIIGLIPLLIWALMETKPERNQWGDPAK